MTTAILLEHRNGDPDELYAVAEPDAVNALAERLTELHHRYGANTNDEIRLTVTAAPSEETG